MKKQFKKVLATFLALMLVSTSLIPPITAEAAISHGTDVSVTQMPRLSGAGNGYFTVDGASSYGYCAQNGKSFWSNNGTKTGTAYEWNDATVRKLLYYAPGGPGYSGSNIASDMDDTTYGIGYVNGMCANNTRARARISQMENLTDPASYGYIAYKVDIPEPYQDVAFLALAPQGDLTLVKSSANSSVTNGNSCYSLEGAVYNVYSNSACTNKVGTLTTIANGTTNTLTLDTGTYYVKEYKAPKGFRLDSKTHTVTVSSNSTATLRVSEMPYDDPITILLSKVDAATGKPSAVGGASLKGAEYTVKYYDGYYATKEQLAGQTAEREWVFATNEKGYLSLSDRYKVSGDGLYYDANGVPVIPLGTISIQETKAPEGYEINAEMYIRQVKMNTAADAIVTYNAPTTPEEIFRGDLEFTKIDGETQKTMANVKFKLTQVESGESHILITDESGYVSTSSDWNLHSHYTNREKRSSDGIWFGIDSDGNEAPVDDTVGALPYGTYTLEELRCEANEGYDLFETVTFTVNNSKQVINLGNLVNNFVELSTVALDSDTSTHVSYADNSATIIDTVSFEGLTPGKNYKLVGTAYDATSKSVLTVNGQEIRVETDFVPTQGKGTTDVTFTFDAAALAGTKIVFTEALYRDGIFIQEHFDLEDEAQSIYFPKVGTNATDKETGHQVVKADGTVTIKDKVTYENLLKGRYKLVGILMDADTGETLKINGKEITSELSFVSDGEDDSQVLEFTIDASEMAGKKVTVFEKLYDRNGKVVAAHEILNAKSQTVHFPKIGTKASDKESGTNITVAKQENIITDVVTYENLIIGDTYKVTGVLMDKDTKEPLLQNGKKITASSTFTATAEDGSVELSFTIKGLEHAGKTAVVFEEIMFESTIVAEHKDINDASQTVYIPKLSTTAYEKESGSNNPIVKENNTIVDKAEYKAVPAGLEYTVKGYLMDKATNDYFLVNGQKVEAQTKFTATDTNGSVELEFNVPGDLAGGKELVVFEELYLGDRLIASHTDINAASQTVKFDYTFVVVNKTDLSTGENVEGATMQLISLVIDNENTTPEETVYKETVVESWTTTKEAHTCYNVKPGLYLIREAKTPAGYVTADDFMFEKMTAYEELAYEIKDDITKMEFSKKDATDQSEIVGAKMQILDEEGSVVHEWTTDGQPYYLEYLPVGSYTLVEQEAPFGYVKAENTSFVVEDTGEIQYVEMLDARVQGYIEIEKLSSVNRNPLKDAEFELRDKDGKVIETLVTDEEGKAKSKLVDIGIYENGVCKGYATYILQETKAPEGFQLDETKYEVSFEYLGDEVPVVSKTYKIPNKMIEKENPVPIWQRVPTGDMQDISTYIVLALGAVILIIAFLKKKKDKNNDGK